MPDRNDVLILRDLTPHEIRGAARATPHGQRRLVTPTVEVESSKSIRFSSLRDDKTVVGMAPVITLKAYRPEARSVTPAVKSNWALDAIGVKHSPFTGAGVKVAVVDSGIDKNHPCFKNKAVKIKSRDFTGEGLGGDSSGHGTHCAATIFGRDYEKFRVGVARGVTEALDAKVFGKSGSCSSPQLVQAVLWAAIDECAAVISLSLGFDFTGLVRELHEEDGLPLELATSRALDSYRSNLRLFDNLTNLIQGNTILVAAAGNESAAGCRISVSPPAIAKGVISVGAAELVPGKSRSKLRIAEFSNTGPTLVAPGVKIVSAKLAEKKDDKERLCEMSGTSMATPHVAGVVALWAEKLAADNAFSADSLIAHLTTSVSREKFQADCDPRDYGAGLVQAPTN